MTLRVPARVPGGEKRGARSRGERRRAADGAETPRLEASPSRQGLKRLRVAKVSSCPTVPQLSRGFSPSLLSVLLSLRRLERGSLPVSPTRSRTTRRRARVLARGRRRAACRVDVDIGSQLPMGGYLGAGAVAHGRRRAARRGPLRGRLPPRRPRRGAPLNAHTHTRARARKHTHTCQDGLPSQQLNGAAAAQRDSSGPRCPGVGRLDAADSDNCAAPCVRRCATRAGPACLDPACLARASAAGRAGGCPDPARIRLYRWWWCVGDGRGSWTHPFDP